MGSPPASSRIVLTEFVLWIVLCQIICAAQITLKQNQSRLETIVEWQTLRYGFPRLEQRYDAEANGNLVLSNGIPIDVAAHYNKERQERRIFVTIPRFQTGIPYTLATLSEIGSVLSPYPNYGWHSSNGRNCDLITSAFRVAIDGCNQMWVIDSGMIAGQHRCPPQLLLFDLFTDKMIHRFRFNNTLYTPGVSIFVTPVIHVADPPETGGRCKKTMVYVADVTQHGLLVYDYSERTAWRIEHKFMYPDPDYGTHTIAGDSFTLMDGILGMATDGRNLYFHPLASESEYYVSLQALNRRDLWLNENNIASLEPLFKRLGQRGSECAAQDMDSAGNLYCVTFNPIKLISWNVRKPYAEHYFCVLPVDTELLQFVSGLKIVRNLFGDEDLWLLSNRFQRVGAGRQNLNEINFRILRGRLSDMRQDDGNCGKMTPDLYNALVFN